MQENKFNIQAILNNKSPLYHQAGQGVRCPVCFILFFRPPSHLSRVDNPTCSRACAIEARKVRVETRCVSCDKPMQHTPSSAIRIVTCSKKCSTLRRAGRGSLNSKKQYHGFIEYKNALIKIAKESICKKCNTNIGSWVVRGLKATWQDDVGIFIDDSTAELWCKKCHFIDISPKGNEAKRTKI